MLDSNLIPKSTLQPLFHLSFLIDSKKLVWLQLSQIPIRFSKRWELGSMKLPYRVSKLSARKENISDSKLQLLTFLKHPEIAHFLFWGIKHAWCSEWHELPEWSWSKANLCTIQTTLLFWDWSSLKVLRWKLQCLPFSTLFDNKYLSTTEHRILNVNSLGNNRQKAPQIDIL